MSNRPRTPNVLSNKFTTPDQIVIDHYVEVVTLVQIRHWRESPGINRCEAWLQGANGAEQLWYALPLDVRGRAGHRYRLCWARAADKQPYMLVGACNLATKKHALTCNTGLAASLFVRSRYGRLGFWIGCAMAMAFVVLAQLVSDAVFRAVFAGVTWWQVGSVPIGLGILGACMSVWRNRRDASRSFDKFVEGLLFEPASATRS